MKSKKENQATWFVKNKINNMIKNNFLKEEENLIKLKKELKEICEEEKIDEMYNNHLNKINTIIEEHDYDKAIKILDEKKKILELANKELIPEYAEKVIKLIEKNKELQDNIKKKYFFDI